MSVGLTRALDALAEAARGAGVDPQEARREGVVLAAAVAEAASPMYEAAQSWAAGTGLADPTNVDASVSAFVDAASAGRRWRAAPTDVLARLRASRGDATRYAAALVDVVESCTSLGGLTPRVTDNIVAAAAAQRGAARSSTAPGAAPPAPGDHEALRSDSVAAMLDALGGLESSLPSLRGLGARAEGVGASGSIPAPTLPEAPTAPAAPTAPTPPAEPAAAEPEPEPPKTVEELLAELDALIGLAAVKQVVRQQVAMLRVEAKREAAGMRNPSITRHLVFVGNPGTGKTTVARMVGGIYKALKLLDKGHLVEVDRSELVAGFLGQTAVKTAEVCARAVGGVLFIDEAYSLTGDQYGAEAVSTLVKEMEDHRSDLVVIVAGYPDPMVAFVAQNPGLSSRFRTTVEFADYTDDEVVSILHKLAADADYDVTPPAERVFREVLAATPRTMAFGNGRFARNLLEEAIGRQAMRIQDVEEPTTAQLRDLDAADFGAPVMVTVAVTDDNAEAAGEEADDADGKPQGHPGSSTPQDASDEQGEP